MLVRRFAKVKDRGHSVTRAQIFVTSFLQSIEFNLKNLMQLRSQRDHPFMAVGCWNYLLETLYSISDLKNYTVLYLFVLAYPGNL